MGKLFEELKRRKVVRVAGVYAVVAWLLIQVTNNIVPALQLPAWTSTLIVVLLLIGFPIALVLAWAFEVSPDGVHRQGAADAPWGGQIPVAQTANTKLLYATFALVLVAVVFQISERFMGNVPTTPNVGGNEPSAGVLPLRSALPLGELERWGSDLRSHIALSPDGRWLVYTARLNGVINLQLRDLVTGETSTLVQVSLEQNNLGRSPFNPSFSPSGEQILYYVNTSGETHVIPRAGGRPQVLAVNTTPYNVGGINHGAPAWLSEDSIVFTNRSGEVQTLHIPTGDIITPDIPDIDGEVNIYPRLMGDGPWLLYTALTNVGYASNQSYASARLDAFNMDTGEVRNLVANGFKGHYLRGGLLIYMRDNGLWAVRVDEQSMQINGGERLIEDRVEANMTRGYTSHALSDNGRLVYLEGGDVSTLNAPSRWVLSARNGERQALNLPANAYHPVFSPDGGQVAVTIQQNLGSDGNIFGYIALYQLADGSLTRRSFTGAAFRPKWTPDGKQLVYGMFMDDTWGLWITAADGSGQPRQLLKATEPVWPESITPDSASLIYAIGEYLGTRFHTLSLLDTAATGQPLLEFGNSQIGAVISPDGRFVAYSSNELHRDSGAGGSFARDLIVRPFPNVNDGRWQITSSGTAAHAVWDSSGKSLYFWLNNGDIYRAPADPDNGFRQGAPELVFDSSMPQSFIVQVPNLAVSPDEQLFLYRELAEGSSVTAAEMTHAVLVDNWIEKVRQMMPVTN
ncbi:MAG: hypothetical protein Q8L60_11470 [Gammaproteobacteria bacterium]|nr:hypothetical protein [Gammaproteobacteria bacterium]MDP2347091.1 hypothetical protein [Gammaproteobacteria bacterium]